MFVEYAPLNKFGVIVVNEYGILFEAILEDATLPD